VREVEKLLTLPEAAGVLRVHPVTLRGWLRIGRNPRPCNKDSHIMSITAVPISIRFVLAPTAASNGNDDASCRAK
jgi:hypothetical protein